MRKIDYHAKMGQEIPALAKCYLDVVQSRQDNAFIRQHFYQVTWLAVPNAEQGDAEFFALEFRIRNYAALAWMPLSAKWTTGGWLKLAHAGADVTCPPTPLTTEYLQQAQSYKSLDAATTHLLETLPPPPSAWQSIKNALRRLRRIS